MQGWAREDGELKVIPNINWLDQPRLQVKFDLDGHDLCLTTTQGYRLDSYANVSRRMIAAEQRAEAAELALYQLKTVLDQRGIAL